MTLQANSNFDYSRTQERSFNQSDIDAQLGQLAEDRISATLARDYLIQCALNMPLHTRRDICSLLSIEISRLSKIKPRSHAESVDNDIAIRTLSNLYQEIRPSPSDAKNSDPVLGLKTVAEAFDNLRCHACDSFVDVSEIMGKLAEKSNNSPFLAETATCRPEISFNIQSLNSSIQEAENLPFTGSKNLIRLEKTLNPNPNDKSRCLSDAMGCDKLVLKSLFSKSINDTSSREPTMPHVLSIHTKVRTKKTVPQPDTLNVNVIFDQNKIKSNKKNSNTGKKRSGSQASRHSSSDRSSARYYLRKQSADAAVSNPDTNRNLLSGFDSIEDISGANLNNSRFQNSNQFDSLSELNLKKMFSKKMSKILPRGPSIPEESVSKEKYTSLKKNEEFRESDSECSYHLAPYDPFGLHEDSQHLKPENDSREPTKKNPNGGDGFKRSGQLLQSLANGIDTSGNNEDQLLGSFEQSFGNLLDNSRSINDHKEINNKLATNYPRMVRQTEEEMPKKRQTMRIEGLESKCVPQAYEIAAQGECLKTPREHERLLPRSSEIPLKQYLMKTENQLKEAFVSPRTHQLDASNPSKKQSPNYLMGQTVQQYGRGMPVSTEKGNTNITFKDFDEIEQGRRGAIEWQKTSIGKGEAPGYSKTPKYDLKEKHPTNKSNKILENNNERKDSNLQGKMMDARRPPMPEFAQTMGENTRYQKGSPRGQQQPLAKELAKRTSYGAVPNEVQIFEMKRGSRDDMDLEDRLSQLRGGYRTGKGTIKNQVDPVLANFNAGTKNQPQKSTLFNSKNPATRTNPVNRQTYTSGLDNQPSLVSMTFEQLLTEQSQNPNASSRNTQGRNPQNQNTNPNREMLGLLQAPTRQTGTLESNPSEGVRRYNSNPKFESLQTSEVMQSRPKVPEQPRKTVEASKPLAKVAKPAKVEKPKGSFK